MSHNMTMRYHLILYSFNSVNFVDEKNLKKHKVQYYSSSYLGILVPVLKPSLLENTNNFFKSAT